MIDPRSLSGYAHTVTWAAPFPLNRPLSSLAYFPSAQSQWEIPNLYFRGRRHPTGRAGVPGVLSSAKITSRTSSTRHRRMPRLEQSIKTGAIRIARRRVIANRLLAGLVTAQLLLGLRVLTRSRDQRPRRPYPRRRSQTSAPNERITIVVPVLDEMGRFGPCLDGLLTQGVRGRGRSWWWTADRWTARRTWCAAMRPATSECG